MCFIPKDLQRHRACSPPENGGQYLRDSAIMLLKTNVEKMSIYGLATMSLKRRQLSRSCHYVAEK
jgi:hypothetical protein